MASDLAREALEQCPFCAAGSDRLSRNYEWDRDRLAYTNIGCDDCDCRTAWFDTEEAADAAWNRRARTASDAIGSGVKARCATCDGAGSVVTDQLEANDSGHYIEQGCPDCNPVVHAALSTHTAAGAGPVGDAAAWRVKDHADDWFLTARAEQAAYYAEQGHAVIPLYARPVEEPGEVERLTRERDEARRDYAELDKATEAALAETRERLENERDRGFNHGYLMAVANIINLHRETVVAADVLLQIDLTVEDAEAFGLAEYDMEALNRLRAEPRAADFFKRQRKHWTRYFDPQEEARRCMPLGVSPVERALAEAFRAVPMTVYPEDDQ